MSIDVLTSPRRRCPVCDTRKVKRSHRTEDEKIEYPEAKSYRCRSCETRFLCVKKAKSPAAEPETAATDDSGVAQEGPSEWGFAFIFMLACVLVAIAIYVLGRG